MTGKPKTWRRWEDWEVDLLLEAEPGELPALAEYLGRTLNAVHLKHGRLAAWWRAVEWNDRELKVLRRLWRDGVPLEDIAGALGRRFHGVRHKVHALKLPKRDLPRRVPGGWTEAEREAVRNPGDRPIQDVARELGRTRGAAYNQRLDRG